MSKRTSGFRGVYHRRDKRWQAQIELNGKTHLLGAFDDTLSAAHAYDRAAKEAFAVPVLNFHADGTLNPERKRRMSSGGPKSSRFRGVYLTGSGRWVAQISVKSRTRILGTFTDQTEAAKAYDTVHQKSGEAVQDNLGWSSSDEDEGRPGQQSDGAVPPSKRSRSSSGAVATASRLSPRVTAAAQRTHGQSPIDLTLEDNDPGVNLKGVPANTPASTAAHAVSSSSSSSPTLAASSATPAPPLSWSSSPAAAALTSSSPRWSHASQSKGTGEAVEQLYHAVMKARMDARTTQHKAMLKKACAIFDNPTAADTVLAFARRTLTNAFGAVNLNVEEHRTTVVEMFIEQLVEQ